MPRIEYDVVWSGATHRQFPTLPAPPIHIPKPRTIELLSRERDVLDHLTSEWQTSTDIATATGFYHKNVQQMLNSLADIGLAEWMASPPKRVRGHAFKLWRRIPEDRWDSIPIITQETHRRHGQPASHGIAQDLFRHAHRMAAY
jgi:hypothetical protein